MLAEIKTVENYLDRLSFLIFASAGNFPKFKPYCEDLNANVQLVWQSLADGLPVIAARMVDTKRMERAEALLMDARVAFERGDRDAGARSLDEMANVIAPDRYRAGARN